MKNALMGTAAVALALSAGMASAQSLITSGRNFDFKVDGFFTAGLGYVDTDDEKDEIGLIRNSEIIFNFELTADNGLTFGAQTELDTEDARNGDGALTSVIDENFAFISGSFGRFEVGEADGAHDKYSSAGIVPYTFAAATDGTGFLNDYYSGDSGLALDINGTETSDALKISYYTPNFSGFEAGISYAPTLEDNGRATSRDPNIEAFEFGAGYSNTFGDFSFDVGAGYTTDTCVGCDDDDSWGVGGKVGFAGFTAGASYGNLANGNDGGYNNIGLGLAYQTGPWATSWQWAFGLDGRNDSDNAITGDIAYALAPGVTTGASIEWGNDDSADRDSFAAGVWLGMGF